MIEITNEALLKDALRRLHELGEQLRGVPMDLDFIIGDLKRASEETRRYTVVLTVGFDAYNDDDAAMRANTLATQARMSLEYSAKSMPNKPKPRLTVTGTPVRRAS